jgi:hypothetical protein
MILETYHISCLTRGAKVSTFLLILMMSLVESMFDGTRAVAQTKYADGEYPPGKIYHEEDLKSLIGQTLEQPSYLVGRFVYLGLVKGRQMFSTFTELPGDLLGGGGTGGGKIAFGKTLIAVNFDGNFPSDLSPGKAIVPTERTPLLLKRVFDGPDGFVFAEAVCESTP